MLDPIKLTKDLVAINSVNPFKTIFYQNREYGVGNETPINLYLEDLLRNLGFEVSRQVYQEELTIDSGEGPRTKIPARWNVLATKGNFKNSLLYLAHTDTVDVKEGWRVDPFIGEEIIVDGEKRFYALGANDMKSGIAAVLASLDGIEAKGYNIKIALVTDEEYWSFGAHALVQSDFLNDVKLCLVPEIMEQDLSDPDACCLGLGRLGRTEFLVEIEGRSCHGSDAFISSSAVNAAHESIKLQSALLPYLANSKNIFKADDIEVINSAYISRHEGGRGILSVPDSASFIIDRGLTPDESVDIELERLRKFIAEECESGTIDKRAKVTVSLRPRPTPPCDPYFISRDNKYAKLLSREILKVSENVKIGIGRGVADENRLAKAGIPCLIIPPRGTDSHTNQEWVGLDSIVRCSNIFKVLNANEELAEVFEEKG